MNVMTICPQWATGTHRPSLLACCHHTDISRLSVPVTAAYTNAFNAVRMLSWAFFPSVLWHGPMWSFFNRQVFVSKFQKMMSGIQRALISFCFWHAKIPTSHTKDRLLCDVLLKRPTMGNKTPHLFCEIMILASKRNSGKKLRGKN